MKLKMAISYRGSSPHYNLIRHDWSKGTPRLVDLWKLRGNALEPGLGGVSGFTCLDISAFGSPPCMQGREQNTVYRTKPKNEKDVGSMENLQKRK